MLSYPYFSCSPAVLDCPQMYPARIVDAIGGRQFPTASPPATIVLLSLYTSIPNAHNSFRCLHWDLGSDRHGSVCVFVELARLLQTRIWGARKACRNWRKLKQLRLASGGRRIYCDQVLNWPPTSTSCLSWGRSSSATPTAASLPSSQPLRLACPVAARQDLEDRDDRLWQRKHKRRNHHHAARR